MIAPMPAPFTAELVARETIAANIAELSFALRSPSRLEFKAGQFVSMSIGPDAPGADPPTQLFHRLPERRRRGSAVHHPGDPRR